MRTKKIYRIIDANINRAKEGLRVCEEITRFLLDNRRLTAEFKKIRHKISALSQKIFASGELILSRSAARDIGKKIYANELKRADINSVFFANVQRSKESVRTLEEFTKLINRASAIEFKKLRYHIYEIEKKAVKKIANLSDH